MEERTKAAIPGLGIVQFGASGYGGAGSCGLGQEGGPSREAGRVVVTVSS